MKTHKINFYSSLGVEIDGILYTQKEALPSDLEYSVKTICEEFLDSMEKEEEHETQYSD